MVATFSSSGFGIPFSHDARGIQRKELRPMVQTPAFVEELCSCRPRSHSIEFRALAATSCRDILWYRNSIDPSQWWFSKFKQRNEGRSVDDSPIIFWKEAKLPSLTQPRKHSCKRVKAHFRLECGEDVRNSGRAAENELTFGSARELFKMCEMEQLDEALWTMDLMHEQGVITSREIIYHLLQECTEQKDLAAGRRVLSLMVSKRLDSVVTLGDHLIRLFSLCGSLEEANLVFIKVPKPSIHTWQAIISAHVTHGDGRKALYLYKIMQQDGLKPNKFIFLCVLKACATMGAIEEGKLIHYQIIKSGLESDVVVGNTIINMYAKCGSLAEACKLFDKLPNRDTVSWNTMIAGYIQHGHGFLALEVFEDMEQQGVQPVRVTLACILKACANIGLVGKGRLIHAFVLKSGFDSDVVIGTTIMDMYSRFGYLQEARKVFDSLQNRNLISWNAMITGYAQHGDCLLALQLFDEMQLVGVNPDKVTFLSVLKACGSINGVNQGRLIHDEVIRRGLESNMDIRNTLIDMYAKCGNLVDADKVFDEILNRDVVSWSAVIGGYAQHGHGEAALELFTQMQQEGLKPDKVTFLSILKACGIMGAVVQGKLIHEQIIKSGLASDVVIGSTLADMYAKCGCLEEACKAFNELPNRDAVSWSAIIAGYAQLGHGLAALTFFEKMQQEGIKPVKATFLSVLKACGSVGVVGQGKLVHEQIISSGLDSDITVGSSLIDMYAKCGNLEEAHNVFEKLSSRDAMSWGVLMTGYGQHGQALHVFELFEKMLQEGVVPDAFTFICVVKACGSLGAIGKGKHIHEQINRTGLGLDLAIGSALVKMYAICGSLEEACELFERLPNRDVASWSAMIAGYAQNGNYKMAGQCLKDMQLQGLKPDGMTYTSILLACSLAGQLKEGHTYLKSMKEDHGISPSIEHFNCMVDLLARAGYLHEAEELLETMPILPDIAGWMSLLAACRAHSNVELGKQSFDQVVRLDYNNAAGHVLMSNIYADAHMWDKACKIEELKKCAQAWKKPGQAWIEVGRDLHEFSVGDKTHLQSDLIYSKLEELGSLMKEKKWLAPLGSSLKPIHDKNNSLCGHCEKLAIAFGLLNTPQGTTIRVSKNIRVCPDCHNVTKFISKIEGRQIIISDAYRVHRFEEGLCSCGDYF